MQNVALVDDDERGVSDEGVIPAGCQCLDCCNGDVSEGIELRVLALESLASQSLELTLCLFHQHHPVHYKPDMPIGVCGSMTLDDGVGNDGLP